MSKRLIDLSPGTVFGGDYRIVSPLAAGGMGAVYVAEQLSTGTQRALKLMLPQLVSDPKLRQRFEQEARIGARIESEHVVQVVGAGVDAETGAPWIAMELLRGEELGALVARAGPLPPAAVKNVMRQLCHAMGAAHDAGIVHRDLKPENIFLAQSKRAEVQFTLKVLDFGIAKMFAEVKTTATASIGSPMWMAPEQAERGASVEPATDVWALGLLAYYMLAGRYYWRAALDESATMQALLKEILLERIDPPSERASVTGAPGSIPAGFDARFARAVNRDVRARFQHAREAFAALEPHLIHQSGNPFLASTQPATSLANTQPAAPLVAPMPTQPMGAGNPPSFPHALPHVAPLRERGGAAPWILGGLIVSVLVIAAGVILLFRLTSNGSSAAKSGPLARASTAPVVAETSPGTSEELPPLAPVLPATAPSVAVVPRPSPSATAATPPQVTAPGPTKNTPAGSKPAADECKCPAGDLMCAMTCSSKKPAAKPGGGFDRGAAAAALGAVNVNSCATSDGPVGTGHVTVDFAQDGTVSNAAVDGGPFPGTSVGSCIARKYRGVTVPPFSDPAPVRVGKSFTL